MVHPYPTAEVNERIRRFPDVEFSGMSGFDERLRTVVALGVGSSVPSHHGARKPGAHTLRRTRLDVAGAFFDHAFERGLSSNVTRRQFAIR